MKSFVTTLFLLGSLGLAAACAEGTEADPAVSFLAATPVEAGAEPDEESVRIPAPSNPSPPDENIDADEDAGTSADAGGTKPDAGADAGGGGGGTPTACTSPNTCAGSTDLGSVSGDVGADTKTASGHTSQWFTVRVTEDDSDVTGIELWMSATLVSPPGTNYDLYVYVPGSDTKECSAVSTQSVSTSSTDKTTSKFGESGLFSNGSNDDRPVTIEVRHVSGTCDPTKKWTLNIEGNK